jgi:hypothetical protein
MRRLPTLAGVSLVLLLAAAVPARAHSAAPGAVARGVVADAAAAAADHAAHGDAPAPVREIPEATPGAAGESPSAPVIAAASLPSPSWAWLLALPAALLAVTRRRPRQAAVIGLALVLTVFAFENAFHSAHHAPGDRHTAGCPVASASLHLAGTTVEGVHVGADAARPTGRAVAAATPAPLARPLRPGQGRAPPSALA